jgi:tetratricopeptide (TPR) repeat protein
MKVLSVALALAACLAITAAAGQKERKAVSKTKVEIAKYEKQLASARAAHLKNPKDPKAKAKFVEMSLQLAFDCMQSPELTPREKYPKALKHYREVLKIEPKNKEALEWKKLIEQIYKDMGRPIPPA